jgi:5'-nucleotidase
MKILISNDDGFLAPGIKALTEALSDIGDVVVVAPNRDYSGASNSLTLDRPLVVNQHEENLFSVNGTPADCVHLALTGILDDLPDIVVSGINNGSNMGEDTLYSGTVAAAMEAYLLGVPSIAMSLSSRNGRYFSTASMIAKEIVLGVLKEKSAKPCLLNVNVPDVDSSSLLGIKTTRLGHRQKAQGAVKVKNPRGQTLYWIGSAGGIKDNSNGTDFGAIGANYVSITPLQTDLTDVSSPGLFSFLDR